MEIMINNGKAPLTKEDAEQMEDAINAFEEGREQPLGRFTIIGKLKKEY